MAAPSVDHLVEDLRAQVSGYLLEKCNRTLVGQRPIKLLNVYVDTFLHCDGSVKEGSEVLAQCRHLLLQGKAGAGKTTFLKYMVLQCCVGAIYPDRVPLWIDLDQYPYKRQDLISYILQQFYKLWERRLWGIRKSRWASKNPITEDLEIGKVLLREGRFLVVFDHLDRLPYHRTALVAQQITELVDSFPECAVLVACRSGLPVAELEPFTAAHVTDFTDDQVTQFLLQYLPREQAQTLQRQWQGHEFTRRPLWLQWTCEDYSHLELCEKGLRMALYQRPSSRLAPGDARRLLAYLALQGIDQNRTTWTASALLLTLGRFQEQYAPLQFADPQLLLEALVVDYGLLIQEPEQHYRFAFLELQAYLCACKLSQSTHPDRDSYVLARYSLPHWRDTFKFLIGLHPDPADLLWEWKASIETLVAEPIYQGLLQWIHESCQNLNSAYRPVTLRAMYLDIDFEYVRQLDRTRALDLAHARTVDRARMRALGKNLEMDTQMDIDYALSSALNLDLALHFINKPVLELAKMLENNLYQGLDQLKAQIPDSKSDPKKFIKWWQVRGMEWSKKLREVTIQHRRNAKDFELAEGHRHRIRQYYEASQFFVECLHTHVANPLKTELEDSLFLPQKSTSQSIFPPHSPFS